MTGRRVLLFPKARTMASTRLTALRDPVNGALLPLATLTIWEKVVSGEWQKELAGAGRTGAASTAARKINTVT